MNMNESGRPAEVLLVEDNENDVILTERGFQSAGHTVNLNHVENGLQCLKYLKQEGEFANASKPDLILLDLNMPVMDGREVLAEIVNDDELRQLPVVVLTTSAEDQDVLDTYRLRCSSYIVKPVEFTQFRRVIEDLGNYWFRLVELPAES